MVSCLCNQAAHLTESDCLITVEGSHSFDRYYFCIIRFQEYLDFFVSFIHSHLIWWMPSVAFFCQWSWLCIFFLFQKFCISVNCLVYVWHVPGGCSSQLICVSFQRVGTHLFEFCKMVTNISVNFKWKFCCCCFKVLLLLILSNLTVAATLFPTKTCCHNMA